MKRNNRKEKVRKQARPVVTVLSVSIQHATAQQLKVKDRRIDALKVCSVYEPFSNTIPVEIHSSTQC